MELFMIHAMAMPGYMKLTMEVYLMRYRQIGIKDMLIMMPHETM